MRQKQFNKGLLQNTAVYIYLMLFIIMFVLSVLTPYGHDDYSYSFSFADNSRIRSVSQIIPSMIVHREILNGRVFPHALVQVFLMFPKGVFSLFNAANAVIIACLISGFLSSKNGKQNVIILLFLLLVWTSSPAFGENCLWLDGSINYAWTITIGTFFLQPFAAEYLGKDYHNSKLLQCTRVVLAFIMGSCSENISLVFLFLAICLMFFIWRKKHLIPRSFWLFILAAVLGYIFLMTAPSMAGRSAEMTASVLANNLARIIDLTKSYLLWVYIVWAGLFSYALFQHCSRERIIFSAFLVLGGAASLSAFVFASYFIPRHFCCTVFLNSFAIAVLADAAFEKKKELPVFLLTACISVFFLFQFASGTLDILVSHHKEQLREQAILAAKKAGEETVILDNYVPRTRYALRFQLDTEDREAWPNNSVASYYELYAVYGRNNE